MRLLNIKNLSTEPATPGSVCFIMNYQEKLCLDDFFISKENVNKSNKNREVPARHRRSQARAIIS